MESKKEHGEKRSREGCINVEGFTLEGRTAGVVLSLDGETNSVLQLSAPIPLDDDADGGILIVQGLSKKMRKEAMELLADKFECIAPNDADKLVVERIKRELARPADTEDGAVADEDE